MNIEYYSPLCCGPFNFGRAVQHVHDAAGFWVVKYSPEKKSFAVSISSRISLLVTSCDLLLDYYFIKEKHISQKSPSLFPSCDFPS